MLKKLISLTIIFSMFAIDFVQAMEPNEERERLQRHLSPASVENDETPLGQEVVVRPLEHASAPLDVTRKGQNSPPLIHEPLEERKFKLGFEFQESSGLCPWALHNINIQKKRAFFLTKCKENPKIMACGD